MKKLIYFVAGVLALVLGILGIFLPLLPATPFLLLAAFCFARSSERFHSWLLNHPRLGPPIRDWQERGVIRTGPKLLATAMLAVSATFLFLSDKAPFAGKSSFAVFACLLLLFLWTRRSS